MKIRLILASILLLFFAGQSLAVDIRYCDTHSSDCAKVYLTVTNNSNFEIAVSLFDPNDRLVKLFKHSQPISLKKNESLNLAYGIKPTIPLVKMKLKIHYKDAPPLKSKCTIYYKVDYSQSVSQFSSGSYVIKTPSLKLMDSPCLGPSKKEISFLDIHIIDPQK